MKFHHPKILTSTQQKKIKPKEISPASCPLFCNPETALTVCLVRFHVFPPVYHQFCQTQQLWHSEFSATSYSSLFIYYSKDWLPSVFRSSTSPLQVHKKNTTTIITKTRPPNHTDSTALGLSGAFCFTAAAGRCSGAEEGQQSWRLLEDVLSPGEPRGLRFQPPQTPTCLVQASPCLDVYEISPVPPKYLRKRSLSNLALWGGQRLHHYLCSIKLSNFPSLLTPMCLSLHQARSWYCS